MALTGLDIYKLLPKTNCKACGFATCLAFAMALAQKKVGLDKCPHVSAAAKEALESASQPPIKLVTIGIGEYAVHVGNEAVMHRHEQKFYHPTAIGCAIDDTLSGSDRAARIQQINSLVFDRIGQKIRPNLVYITNRSNAREPFVAAVTAIVAATPLGLCLAAHDVATLEAALAVCATRRPLVVIENTASADGVIALCAAKKLPLAITAATIEEAAARTEQAKKAGVDEIIINLSCPSVTRRIQDYTLIRRAALKKNVRSLGFPLLAQTTAPTPALELAEAVAYVMKYAGIVIVRTTGPEFILPLLVARHDIYADPQKPVQVEPKIYEIGKVTSDSPVAVTTNFSITYFTVAGEFEASKVPTYLVCCDADGMSVLTAWAAEKFTAERIAETLKKSGIETKVSHRKLIIPGYVSVLSGKLEEASGWKIMVGPREASGIPAYLRSWK